MRKRLLLLCAGTFFLAGQMRAQWVVTDPGNLAQSIINMSDNIVHTSSTATSTAQNFAETVKIYQQYKKYYDALKSVNNLVKDARKVSEIILMVGDVSEIYVTNFQKMLGDENFSPRGFQTSARFRRFCWRERLCVPHSDRRNIRACRRTEAFVQEPQAAACCERKRRQNIRQL